MSAERDGQLLVHAGQTFRERDEDEAQDTDDAPSSRTLRIASHPLDEERVGHFLNDRLVCFMAALDARRRQIADRPENLVTDPVCGMAFNRLDAAAETVYERIRYFFCLDLCRERFLEEPDRYATVF